MRAGWIVERRVDAGTFHALGVEHEEVNPQGSLVMAAIAGVTAADAFLGAVGGPRDQPMEAGLRFVPWTTIAAARSSGGSVLNECAWLRQSSDPWSLHLGPVGRGFLWSGRS